MKKNEKSGTEEIKCCYHLIVIALAQVSFVCSAKLEYVRFLFK